MRTIIGWLVLLWLVIGAFAGYQRGLYTGDEADCSGVTRIAATIGVGPLNYFGVNPKFEDCPKAPKPSR